MNKLILNAKIVRPKTIKKANILINEKGKIVKISKKQPKNFKGKVIDVQGKYVLPGLIEVHGHMREPGLSHKGTVKTETRAAAAGGVTMVLDMPNTRPPTITKKLLKIKQEKIYPGRSYVDYAFLFGVAGRSKSPNYLKELAQIDKMEIAGVKVFTAGHETVPTSVTDLGDLAEVFQVLAKRKIPVCVHAENQQLLDYFTKKLQQEKRKDTLAWSEARNELVVSTAALEVLSLASYYGNKIYMLHLSTEEEFNAVTRAREQGIEAVGEVVTYQLFFNTNDYKKLGNLIKVSPTLRSPKTQGKLWKLVKNRKVDTICSEHTPHTWKEKQNDVWTAPSGTPGIQESLPAFLTKWVKRYGKRSLEEGLRTATRCMSKNIADFFGFKSKGEIKIGKDADLVVIDVDKKWAVKKQDLFTKCKWSAYEGEKLTARPLLTLLKGKVIYKDGKITGEPKGKWVQAK